MIRTIRIKMAEKEVNVAPAQNVLTVTTVKTLFLLPSDATVSLSYKLNDVMIGCELNEAGSLFFLPQNWENFQFFADSDKVLSRPTTPMEEDSRSSSPDWQRVVISFLLETEHGCCVTVLAKRAAITCVHCLNSSIEIGSNITVRPCRKSTISAFPNGKQSAILQVEYINKHMDFVFLVSNTDLCSDPPTLADAEFGETYVLLGLSGSHREYSKLENLKIKVINGPLCVKRGVVSSKILDKFNKHMGDSGMKKGDSGGGLYTLSGDLIGIAVEFDSKRNSGISMCHFNPATIMLAQIQDQGYSLCYLNNFEGDAYPQKEDFCSAEDRDH